MSDRYTRLKENVLESSDQPYEEDKVDSDLASYKLSFDTEK